MVARDDEDALLAEQLAYYRAGAAEYDAGVRRTLYGDSRSEYDEAFRVGAERGIAWLSEVVEGREVLEIAAGTGIYTEHLARRATQITALDASPESLAINRSHLTGTDTRIEFLCADIFSWMPHRRFEAVVFAFWLSHVPLSRFDAFWDAVAAALRPGGEVAFVDVAASGAGSGRRPGAPDLVVEDRPDEGVTVRKLDSGDQFRIVRIPWDPEALTSRVAALGWNPTVRDEEGWLLGRATLLPSTG